MFEPTDGERVRAVLENCTQRDFSFLRMTRDLNLS